MGTHSWERRQLRFRPERLERETSLRGNDHKCLPPPPRQEGKDNAPARLKEEASHSATPRHRGPGADRSPLSFSVRSQGWGQLSTQQSPGNDTERPLRKVQAWGEGWGRCDQPPSGGGKGCLQGIPAPTFQLDEEAVITPPVSTAGEGGTCGSRVQLQA